MVKKTRKTERLNVDVKKCLQAGDPLSIECLKILAKVSRESRVFDFKGQFDVKSRGDWIELAKDFVAIANSGGGYILFGKDSAGKPTHYDFSDLIETDQAVLADKFGAFVNSDIGGVALASYQDGDDLLAIMYIPRAEVPIIFTKQGAYPDPNNSRKQKWVFRLGMLFFRHGSKSEPAKQSDIDKFLRQYLKEMRSHLIRGMRTVVKTPISHKLITIPKEMNIVTDRNASGMRISDEENSIPVRGLADGRAYSSIEQELLGIVSGMKTDPADFASEAQLRRLYSKRKAFKVNEEAHGALLISALHRHAPPCYWASELSRDSLENLLSKVVQEDTYPSVNAAIWVAFCLGSGSAKKLIERARKNSTYISARNASMKALAMIDNKHRISKMWAPKTIKYESGVIEISDIEKQFTYLEKVLDGLIEKAQEQVKLLDRLCYGPRISKS